VAFSPDSRSIALGHEVDDESENALANAVGLWEVSTGKKRWWSPRVGAAVTALAFSPDGKVLAAAYGDTTVLLWDVTERLLAPPRGAAPSAEELERLWADLDARDGRRAYRAVHALAAAPKEAVPLLRRRVAPAAGKPLAAAEVARRIAELGADDFAVRERAYAALARQGRAVEADLREALGRKPGLEHHRRLERLLDELPRRAVPPELIHRPTPVVRAKVRPEAIFLAISAPAEK
jgi:hypothetical protein